MITLSFYTTTGCHLCEQAIRIVNEVHDAKPRIAAYAQLEFVDIAEKDELIETYGTRIPVLAARKDKQIFNKELSWPFDHQAYIDFLNNALAYLFAD